MDLVLFLSVYLLTLQKKKRCEVTSVLKSIFFGAVSCIDIPDYIGGLRGRMVVGFTTTCAINATCEFEPRLWRGVLDTTICDRVC